MTRRSDERGFAMLLVFLMAAMIAITLYMEIPRVSFESQRAKEQLLIERGEQYKRAIQVFVRANKKYPGSIQELESFNNHRYLRKQYVDPITGKKEWRLVHIGAGGAFTDSLVNKPKDDKDKDKKGDGSTTSTQNFTDPNNPTGQPQQPSAVPPRRQSEMGGLMPGGAPGQAGYGVQQQPQIDPATGQPITQAGMPGSVPGAPASVYPTGMPGQVVPGQPYPGQVIPGQPYPAQPGQPIPGQPYPTPTGQVVPGQPYPMQPGQVVPGQPYPAQPGQVVPGQPYGQPGQVVPGQPYPAQPGQVVPGQPYGQPGQVVPGQPYYGQPGQVVPGQPYPTTTPGVVPGQPGYPYSTQPGAQGAAPPFTQPGMSPAAGRGLGTSNDAQKMIQDLLTRPRTGLPNAPAQSVGQQIGGGIAGVASTAEAEGIKVYNDKTNYKEWEFIYDYTKDKGPGVGPQTGAGTPVNELGTPIGQQPAGAPGQQPAGTAPQQPSPFGAQPGAFPPTGRMPMPPTSR